MSCLRAFVPYIRTTDGQVYKRTRRGDTRLILSLSITVAVCLSLCTSHLLFSSTESWVKMMMMMMKMSPWLLLLGLAVTYTAAAGPGMD